MVDERNTFWWRLVHLDPALLRGLVTAIVLLLISLGVVVSPQIPDTIIGFIAALFAIIQALWTKPAVTPNARVAVLVPDPVNQPDVVAPGEAVTTATAREIVAAATEGIPSPNDGV